MNWFFIALLAPISWSVVNHIDKFILVRYGENRSESIGIIMLFSTLFSITVIPILFILKPSIIYLDIYHAFVLSVSGLCYALFLYFYLRALILDETSIVMAIFQTVPIFGFIFSFLFLGEILTITQSIGALIILIFSFILVSNAGSCESIRFKWNVLFFALFSSIMYSLSETIFKYGSINEGFMQGLFWNNVGLLLFGIGLISFKSNRQGLLRMIEKNGKNVLFLNILGEILTLFGDIITRFVLFLAPVSLVLAISDTQPIFVLIISLVIFFWFPRLYSKEKYTMKQIIYKAICIVFIVAGSILVALV